MKRLLTGALAALLSFSAMAATLTPIQLLSPVGSTSGQVIASTGPTTAPAWTTVTLSGLGGLAAANNLSDVASTSAALSNLGGLSSTTAASTYLTQANAASTYAAKANNLSDLASATTARTNLGLGTSAVVNTGTSGATVPLLSTANTWTLAQAFTVRPTFNSNTPWDSGNLAFATPPAIGGTTPAAGAFTTLSASSNDVLTYTNTSAQSIPNNTSTAITGWTKTFDRLNTNFSASTGVFTAPVTGFYHVDAGLVFAAAAGVVNAQYAVSVVANAAIICQGAIRAQTTASVPYSAVVGCDVSVTAGQTISITAFENSGAALATAAGTFVSIHKLP